MIKNKKTLLKNFPEGKIVLDLAEEALRFLQPDSLVKNQVFSKKSKDQNILKIHNKKFNLNKYKNIYVVGAGKATYKMAQSINKILNGKIKKGFINVPVAKIKKIGNIIVNKASHPLPDKNGIKGTKKIINLLKKAGKDDLVICLMSGGGSALMPAPTPPLTLNEKINLTRQLLKSSANIYEINIVRKFLSQVKGGKLAQIALPATVIALYISDVPHDDLRMIAAGPTVIDKSSPQDALQILKKYEIKNQKIREIIKKNKLPQNFGKNKVFNFIVGSNKQVLIHLKKFAKDKSKNKNKNLNIKILPNALKGKATKMSKKMLTSILSPNFKKNTLIIAGGETVVKVTGNGMGGRNQEFSLSSIPFLKDGIVVLSLATDGVDGITKEPVAGAIVSYKLKTLIKKKDLDISKYLNKNDSYHCLKLLNCLIKTGPSGTNVGDIVFIHTNLKT
jgi:glycerate-2-kinase